MIIKAISIIGLPLVALIIGFFFLGLSRKVIARIHRRYGPPISQPLIDVIKLISQESISHGKIFDMGVILSLAGSVILVLFIPFGGIAPLATSGDLLVVIYLMLLAPLGVALSGGEAANPNVSIGISRKMMLALGYEVPFLFSLLAVMTWYKTTSLVEVVKAQQSFLWGLFYLPLPAVAYFMILPAMLGIRPFDIVSAPQEIASGTAVEYGGRYLALTTIQHAFHIFIDIALFVSLFLGGGSPFTFFLKMLVVFLLGLFINAVFPRLRIDQAIKYCWRWPAFIAFLGLVIAFIVA
ncbi:MAG: complex I subunit 1 family protein [Candidatus Aerophobetes bacterium]|nr:complex I subunit 1 family protein [Candidatus Aerophobetes bacterium]